MTRTRREHVSFSVDYPFSPNGRGRAFLDGPPLGPAGLEKFAQGNADRLLKLGIERLSQGDCRYAYPIRTILRGLSIWSFSKICGTSGSMSLSALEGAWRMIKAHGRVAAFCS